MREGRYVGCSYCCIHFTLTAFSLQGALPNTELRTSG